MFSCARGELRCCMRCFLSISAQWFDRVLQNAHVFLGELKKTIQTFTVKVQNHLHLAVVLFFLQKRFLCSFSHSWSSVTVPRVAATVTVEICSCCAGRVNNSPKQHRRGRFFCCLTPVRPHHSVE